jgi:hypothetical protein
MAKPIPAKGNPSLATPSRLWILLSNAVEDPVLTPAIMIFPSGIVNVVPF